MLHAELATQTVTRLRAETVSDGYNSDERDWDNAAREGLEDVALQPLQGSEFNEGRDAITTRWTLFLQPWHDLRSTDRIVYNGNTYEVDGSVPEWEDGTNFDLGYKYCYLKMVQG